MDCSKLLWNFFKIVKTEQQMTYKKHRYVLEELFTTVQISLRKRSDYATISGN